jgi:integrase
MTGTTFVRCACRGEDGKQLGAKCPELANRRHGTRMVGLYLETSAGRIKYRRTVGPAASTTQTQAKAALEQISDLVKLGRDAATIARIGDLIVAAKSGPLPEVADVRRRLGLAGDLTGAQSTRELFEEWFAAKRRWRESTRKSHREHLDQHILPVIGDIAAERLNNAHVWSVFERIEARNAALAAGTLKAAPGQRKPQVLSLQTQHHIYATIRAALNWAVRNRKLAFNPAAGVELETVPKHEVTVYDAEQIVRFLSATRDDRLAVGWRLILLLGMRRGEMLGLRWAGVHLDDEHPYLEVTDTVLQLGGKVIAGKPKTWAGERTVFLDPDTVGLLKAHRTAQASERLAWASAYADHDLVFAREDGTPYRPDQVSATFKKLAKAADLPVIRLHEGRHSAATLALASGEDIKKVSHLLGHSTTAITQNLYTHVTPKVAQDTVTRMARLIALPKRDGEAESV